MLESDGNKQSLIKVPTCLNERTETCFCKICLTHGYMRLFQLSLFGQQYFL